MAFHMIDVALILLVFFFLLPNVAIFATLRHCGVLFKKATACVGEWREQ
jgi:hypothetical protein